MAIPINNPNLDGAFIPSTYIVDVAQLYELEVTSDEFKELLIRLYQNLNQMALVLNAKTSGYYALNQFVTGNQYFPNPPGTGVAVGLVQQPYRPTTRIVINFGALPNNSTKSVAHGITVGSWITWVHIYGTATDPNGLTGIPLPYASGTAGKVVELYVDQTNVNVITHSNLSNYTICYIVLEFLTM